MCEPVEYQQDYHQLTWGSKAMLAVISVGQVVLELAGTDALLRTRVRTGE